MVEHIMYDHDENFFKITLKYMEKVKASLCDVLTKVLKYFNIPFEEEECVA